MKGIRFTILCILIAVICTGCYPVGNLYQLPPPNMPLPFNPGETKLNPYLSSQGYGLQASCAIDSHFVMMVNVNGQNTQYNRWYPSNDDLSLSTTVVNFQGDIGGGYYTHLDTMVRFEILGGIGYADSYYHDISPGYIEGYNVTSVTGQFIHLLLQSDVGLVGKHAELSVGFRLSNLVAKTDYDFSYNDVTLTKQNYILDATADALFIEPYLTFALGFKNIKLIASATESSKIFGPDISIPVPSSLYQNFNFSLGLLININRKDIKR